MTNRGLLLTMTEPTGAMEEEFNAWYDTEHLPERLAIPGFRSARRWVAPGAPGEGKYRATYELDSPAVLQSPEYLARYAGATPWTHALAKSVLLLTAEREIDLPPIAGALQVRRFAALPGSLVRLYRDYAT
jgi:hypothetical protein